MPHCTHPLFATNHSWIRRIKRRTRWIKPIIVRSVIKSFSKKYRYSPINARAEHRLERKLPRSLGRRRRLMLATRHTSVLNVMRLLRARSQEMLTWKCTPSTCVAVRYVMITDDSNRTCNNSVYYAAILYCRRRHAKLKWTMNRCQNCVRRHWNTYLLSSRRLKLTSRVHHLHLLNGPSLKPLAGKEMLQTLKNTEKFCVLFWKI